MRANNKSHKPVKRTLLTCQLVGVTGEAMNDYMKWQRKHVCKSLRTRPGTLAAECLYLHLPDTIASDRHRHLKRNAANCAE